MSKYLKDRYRDFDSYTPGEQPVDKEYIKLNTNESPYPPGPKVLEAISSEELEKLRLYPSPVQGRLKEKLAESFEYLFPEINQGNVFVSNGSDDVLNFAFMAYCGDGKAAVYPNISYGFYEVFAGFQGVPSIMVPLDEEFRINPRDYRPEKYNADFRNSGEEPKVPGEESNVPGLIVFANPNAPTGICLSLDEVEEIIKNNPESVVLVDEAYIDFGGDTAIGLVAKYDNVIIARTYSKSASLAGARLGYAIASPELIRDLELIKYSTNPYNVNRMTELVGLAVLEESDYYKDNCNRIQETRNWTVNKLKEMGFKVLDSKANFVFVDVRSLTEKDLGGQGVYLAIKERGILVRWFNKDLIRDYIRVSIGTKEDMEAFIEAMKGISEEQYGE